MMKRTLFFPLALLLAAGIFSTAVHAEPPAAKKEAANVTKLIKIDKKKGKGETATAGREVAVHYTGWLYDATVSGNKGKKFDSSLDRGEPIVFPLGAGMVIAGWEQGLEGMKVGGQRTLIIPPHLGYGARGAPGAIPPNATLVFDVELMGVR
ncbi:MAG TPA: FKBP-type peptidyl-prolyl cis-trans isomerase [Gallionella sp.]|jgi:FKBP-type peptidyl-prolyl cis-trans isomerase|nr:FKBP-type peptidyl-prolyl cis-trans isomerase [Gallionella sp.]